MEILEEVGLSLAAGRPAEAWALIRGAMEREPGNGHLALAAFHVACALGLRRESRALLARAAALADSPFVHLRLGDVAREEGRFAAALREYRRAGTSAEAQHGVYLALRDAGRRDAAREMLAALGAREPVEGWVVLEEARTLASEGDRGAAVGRLLRLPSPDALLAAAELLLHDGRFREAEERLQEAHALAPEDTRVLYRLAKERERAGDRRGAVGYIEKFQSLFHAPELLDFQKAELLPAGEWRTLLEGIAARLGLGPEIAALWRKKLALLGRGAVFHSLRGVTAFEGFEVRLVPCLHGRDGEVEEVRASLQRFLDALAGAGAFVCTVERSAGGAQSFDVMERAILLRNPEVVARCALGRKLRKEGEAVVALVARTEGGGTANVGFGGYRHAAIVLGPPRATLATTVMHEVAHAVLDLAHTDGRKDVSDPFSLLGAIGEDNTLDVAYLNPVQRLRLATDPRVQAVVTRAVRLDRRCLGCDGLTPGERRRLASRALEGYRRAVGEDPLYLGLYPRAAAMCLVLERLDEALALLRRLFSLYPAADHCAKIAELLITTGRVGEAREIFTGALGYGTSDIVWQRAGLAFSRGCLFAEAGRYFRKALRMCPGNPSNIFNMAVWYHGVWRFEDAVEWYGRALSLEERWPQVRNRLALALAQMGRGDEAEAQLRASARVRRGGMDLHYFRARVLFQLGGAAEALEAMRRAQRCEPREQGSHYYLGSFSLALGCEEAALEAFARARVMEASSFVGRSAAAHLAHLEGRHGEALRMARALLRRNPRHTMLMALGLLCCRELGDPAGAERFGADLAAREPRHPLAVEP